MTTTYKLYDGRRVTVEQTMTRIIARVDGGEPKTITSTQLMGIVMSGTQVGPVE